MTSDGNNDNGKTIPGSPDRLSDAESNDQSPSAGNDTSGTSAHADINDATCAPCIPRKKSFSPVRGSMDDEENFEFTQETPVPLQAATSNESQRASNFDDEYDEEEEGIFDATRNGNNTTAKSEAIAKGGMMVTSTKPVNLYDLSGAGLGDAMYATAPNRNHGNSESEFRGRSESKLFVRHLTRASVLIGDEDAEDMSPALKRRLRDFRFAQRKRRDRYGEQNPWGIIGLYDHLTGIRTDIEWAGVDNFVLFILSAFQVTLDFLHRSL